MATSKLNESAILLRSLHKPGTPVIFTNAWDHATAKIAAEHPATRAVATASFAMAAGIGVPDDDLSLPDNLRSMAAAAAALKGTGIPLTGDLQDGYADVAATVKAAIAAGAVGGNIEDMDDEKQTLRSKDEAVARVKEAVRAAKEAGVPDFCVNARTDTLMFGGTIEDAIDRGKAYLAAGALTVYVWGGRKGRGVSQDEIKRLVEAFGGMLNVKMNLGEGFLRKEQLAELGVARISIGPELYHKAMKAYREGLAEILK